MIRFCASVAAAIGMLIASAAEPVSSPAPNQEWGLVTVACASLRSGSKHSAELETQAIMGTPVLLFDKECDGWRYVKMPDGYESWMHTSAFVAVDSAAMARWRGAPRVVVTDPYPVVAVTDTLVPLPYSALTDLTVGAVVEGEIQSGNNYVRIVLPDGRKGFVRANSVADFRRWCSCPMDLETVLAVAASMNGVTYLWGGTTPKAVDCSGFTQICYRAAGRLLPRNASQQAMVGIAVAVDDMSCWNPGDLLFFGEGDDTEKVTHVGIYTGDSCFVHASGRVFKSSVSPEHPLYLPRKVIGVRRVADSAALLRGHPWYF